MKRIAVLTSGGDAPGMNAAVRAVVERSLHHGIEVVGAYYGFKGLYEGDFRPLDGVAPSYILLDSQNLRSLKSKRRQLNR